MGLRVRISPAAHKEKGMIVAELKKILEDVSDDMEIEIYEGRGGLPVIWAAIVQCDDLNCPDCGGEGKCYPPKFVIASD